MLSIFKEIVHTVMLACRAPFVRLILLHNLFFPPFGEIVDPSALGQNRSKCCVF